MKNQIKVNNTGMHKSIKILWLVCKSIIIGLQIIIFVLFFFLFAHCKIKKYYCFEDYVCWAQPDMFESILRSRAIHDYYPDEKYTILLKNLCSTNDARIIRGVVNVAVEEKRIDIVQYADTVLSRLQRTMELKRSYTWSSEATNKGYEIGELIYLRGEVHKAFKAIK